MPYLRELYHWFSINAPFETQEEWDNAGLMVGDQEAEMKGIYIDMDLTLETIQKAKENGCNVILTHHPFFFDSIKSLDFQTGKGAIVKELIEEKMHVIAAHTNWDVADRGVNYALTAKLGMKNARPLEDTIGWIADGEGKPLHKWLSTIANTLDLEPKYSGSPYQRVEKILVCGGGGGHLVDFAHQYDAQLVLTGESKHHQSLLGEEGVCLVEIGHYESEYPGLVTLKEELVQDFSIPIVVADDTPTLKTWKGEVE